VTLGDDDRSEATIHRWVAELQQRRQSVVKMTTFRMSKMSC